jgi:hypothetical protein
VPSTARYARTALNIANGREPNVNEEIKGGKNDEEDRFRYYMRMIAEDAESFRLI